MNASHVDTIISTSMTKSVGDKSMSNIDIVQRSSTIETLTVS